MTTTEAEPTIEAEAPAEMEPVVTHDVHTAPERVSEALMAVPVAMLCAANTATIIGASAWQLGGATGLLGTGAALSTAAGAGWMVRRAHRAEARRREENDDTKTAKAKAASPAKPGHAVQPTTGVRAGLSALGRNRRVARAQRKGGASTGRGSGKALGMPSLGMPSRQAGSGSGRRAAGGTRSAMGGKAAGGSRLSKLAGLGRAGAGRKTGTAAAGRMPGMAAPGSTGRASGGAAGRRAAGHRAGKAGGGVAALRRAAGSGTASAGRTARGISRAGSAGAAKLGRGTHAVAGSRPGQRAAASGRRLATAAKGAAGATRRAHSSGRAAIAGAAQAKGQGVRAAAKAAKAGIAAEHARQDRATGKAAGRITRMRRLFTRNAAGAGAGSAVLTARGARGAARWGRWGWRAVCARLSGSPVPPTPGKAEQQEAVPQSGHPPVAATVTQPPASAGQIQPTQGVHQMSTLGLLLHDLSGQMAAAATGYEPDGMLQWGADMQALEGVLQNVAGVLHALEKGAEDLPIEPAVKHTLASVGALQSSCSSAAAEIHTTFRAVHEAELDRLENPRPAEHKWDSAANQ